MLHGVPQNSQEVSSIMPGDEGDPEITNAASQTNQGKESPLWVA